MSAPTEHVEEALHPAVAAALAMPPMTAEEIATVAAILAGIQARQAREAEVPVETVREVA